MPADQAVSTNPPRRICATEPHLARRYGWYAIVRAPSPTMSWRQGPPRPGFLCHRRCPAPQRPWPPHDDRHRPRFRLPDRGPWSALSIAASGVPLTNSRRCVTWTFSCTIACIPMTTRPKSSRPSNRTCGPDAIVSRITRMIRWRCRTGRSERPALLVLQGTAPQPLVARRRDRGRLGKIGAFKSALPTTLLAQSDCHDPRGPSSTPLRRRWYCCSPRLAVLPANPLAPRPNPANQPAQAPHPAQICGHRSSTRPLATTARRAGIRAAPPGCQRTGNRARTSRKRPLGSFCRRVNIVTRLTSSTRTRSITCCRGPHRFPPGRYQ